MFKNIYRYKIKYTNFLGGSNFVNQDTSENSNAANILQNQNNQNNLEEAIPNFQNLEISEPENQSNFNLKFKNKNEWPQDQYEWSSRPSLDLRNEIWDENGEGKIISGDRIKFNNNSNITKITKRYISIDNVSFKTDAFIDEDQNKLTIFLQNNGINLDENEIAEEVKEEFVWDENGIKFKNKNEWPQGQYEWSSRPSLNLRNEIWHENGEGKIISGDRIKFNNNSNYTKIYKEYILIDNVSFKIDAFTEESQVTLKNFLRSNGITIY